VELNVTRLPILTGIAAIAIVTAAPAQTPALADVSAHLKAVETMTAAFAQTDRSGRTVTGTLTLKRPGKIRFQYQKGVPTLIVGDGKGLTFIDYQVRQVQRWPIRNTPLGVLLEPNRDLAGYARIVPSADPRIVLVEARDKKHPEYGVITLAFTRSDSAPAGLMLQGWAALDSQNNRTTIRLSNQQFNVPVSDKAFIWRDPRPKIPGR
jgi:outer membrane lipoprotein-sorting protein